MVRMLRLPAGRAPASLIYHNLIDTAMDERKRDNTVTLARAISPEDIRPEMYVTMLSIVTEHLPFIICADDVAYRQPETFRVQWVPRCEPQPLKVLEVCLPFVLVKQPDGALRTLDVRRYRLAQLSEEFGKKAFKMLKAKAKRKRDRRSFLSGLDELG